MQQIGMTVVRRFRLPGIVKVALWTIALFLLWRIVSSQVLLEPLFLFLTAGQVPGTNIRLSPDTVLGALPFVFAGIVILIFNRELRQLLRWIVRVVRRRPAPETDLAHDESDVTLEDVFEPEPVKALQPQVLSAAETIAAAEATASRQPSKLMVWLAAGILAVTTFLNRQTRHYKPVVKRIRMHIRTYNHRLLIAVIPHLDKAAYYTGYGLGWVKRHGAEAWLGICAFARLAWKISKVESRHAAQFTRANAIRLWRWASPYFWRLDTWLGIKLEQLLRHPYVRHGRHAAHDMKRDIIKMFKK